MTLDPAVQATVVEVAAAVAAAAVAAVAITAVVARCDVQMMQIVCQRSACRLTSQMSYISIIHITKSRRECYLLNQFSEIRRKN